MIAGIFPVSAAPQDGGENEHGKVRIDSSDRFIPLIAPQYGPISEAKLGDAERVVGLKIGDDARCFPIRQLYYHHVVNDTIGGLEIALTYCIMADTAVCYLREAKDQIYCVGGLYGGALLLREQNGDDVFAQIAAVPVPDNPTSLSLRLGPAPIITSFGLWKEQYPASRVLAPVEKFEFYYEAFDRRPMRFNNNPQMNQTITHHDERLPSNAIVYGVAKNGVAMAWTLEVIEQAHEIRTQLGDESVTVIWNTELNAPMVKDPFDGYCMRSFWYAWSSFYPETNVQAEANHE